MMESYRLVLSSAVGERDGMGLELTHVDGGRIAEVFEDGDTGARTVTLFEKNVPTEAIEWLLAESRLQL